MRRPLIPTIPTSRSAVRLVARRHTRARRGELLLVESMATAWGEGPGAAPHGDWRQHRFGADPPAVLEMLRTSVGRDVLTACGVPPALFSSTDGTAAREGWRRFVLASCAGLAAIIADELAAKLSPVSIKFDAFVRQGSRRTIASVRAAGESGRHVVARGARGVRPLKFNKFREPRSDPKPGSLETRFGRYHEHLRSTALDEKRVAWLDAAAEFRLSTRKMMRGVTLDATTRNQLSAVISELGFRTARRRPRRASMATSTW